MKHILQKRKEITKSVGKVLKIVAPDLIQILKSSMPIENYFCIQYKKIKNIPTRNFLNASLTPVSLLILLALTRQISSSLYQERLRDHIQRCDSHLHLL